MSQPCKVMNKTVLLKHLLAPEGLILKPAYPLSASALYRCDGNAGTSLPETGEVFKYVKVGCNNGTSGRHHPVFQIKLF